MPTPASSRNRWRLTSRTKSCRCCLGKWRRSRFQKPPGRPLSPVGRRCPTPMVSFILLDTMLEIASSQVVRNRPGEQGREDEEHGFGTFEEAVAGDRTSQLRLRLEWLCGNDEGFPSTHRSEEHT